MPKSEVNFDLIISFVESYTKLAIYFAKYNFNKVDLIVVDQNYLSIYLFIYR